MRVRIARKRFHAPGRPRFTAIEGLDFTVPPGEFLCVVGPSGAGKSTLLAILAGLDDDWEGEIERAKGGSLGVMFQTPRLMPWKTVIENVRLVASPQALAERRAERLLDRLGLADAADLFPNRLSGGMQRRAALARAFVNRPSLLLLDEPSVSLDAPAAANLRRLLLELWADERCTVIYVTHDLREALYLADRILFLTPSPARVAFDFRNPLPRPRTPDAPELEALRADLRTRRPDLLGDDHRTVDAPTG